MNQVSQWVRTHPRLTAWIVLGLGMNAMVIYEARSVGLLLGQWVALVVATSLVAGLCVWIIGWEDDEDDEPAPAEAAAERSTGEKPSTGEQAPAGEAKPATPPKKS
jgi:hypothetical protein